MGLYKLERYSHEGYLIKVVVMALAGEVTRKLSPILSWSNNNYDLKLGEKARGQELHIRSDVWCSEDHLSEEHDVRNTTPKDTIYSRHSVMSP